MRASVRSSRAVVRSCGRAVVSDRGFSLLEVLLAMVIFSLVAVSVLMTLRTATRTYERSGKAMVTLQAMRAVTDTLTRDLRSTFLVNETNYGVELPTDERQETEIGNPPPPPSGVPGAVNTVTESDALITEEDFADPSLIEDLSFLVSNSQDNDSVTFVRRLRSMETRRAQPWGLVRVTYSVEDDPDSDSETGMLVRTSEPVFGLEDPVVPLDGETLEEAEERVESERQPMEAAEETLARGVARFDVQCLFWELDTWKVTDEWNSEERQHRNPYSESAIQQGTSNWAALDNAVKSQPLDGLPAALEITLGLQDETTGLVRTTRLLVPLEQAQETWSPPDPELMGQSGSRRGRGGIASAGTAGEFYSRGPQ